MLLIITSTLLLAYLTCIVIMKYYMIPKYKFRMIRNFVYVIDMIKKDTELYEYQPFKRKIVDYIKQEFVEKIQSSHIRIYAIYVISIAPISLLYKKFIFHSLERIRILDAKIKSNKQQITVLKEKIRKNEALIFASLLKENYTDQELADWCGLQKTTQSDISGQSKLLVDFLNYMKTEKLIDGVQYSTEYIVDKFEKLTPNY